MEPNKLRNNNTKQNRLILRKVIIYVFLIKVILSGIRCTPPPPKATKYLSFNSHRNHMGFVGLI